AADKGDGEGELEGDQRPGKEVGAADADLVLQDFDGPEAGQHEGRVAAGEDAGDDGYGQQQDEQLRGLGEGKMKLTAGQAIERRGGSGGQAETECGGDGGEEDRFGEELDDDLAFCRPDDLADAHLLAASGGAGDGEGGEIDTGDEEDAGGDTEEDPKGLWVDALVVREFPAVKPGVGMYIEQGLPMEGHRRFILLPVFSQILPRSGWGEASLKAAQLFRVGRQAASGLKLHVSHPDGGVPVVANFEFVRAVGGGEFPGSDDIETDGGIDGRVFGDAGN